MEIHKVRRFSKFPDSEELVACWHGTVSGMAHLSNWLLWPSRCAVDDGVDAYQSCWKGLGLCEVALQVSRSVSCRTQAWEHNDWTHDLLQNAVYYQSLLESFGPAQLQVSKPSTVYSSQSDALHMKQGKINAVQYIRASTVR